MSPGSQDTLPVLSEQEGAPSAETTALPETPAAEPAAEAPGMAEAPVAEQAASVSVETTDKPADTPAATVVVEEKVVAAPPAPDVETAEVTPAPACTEEKAETLLLQAPPQTPLLGNIARSLESSGLVMVETSCDKIQSWQPEAPAPAEPAPRPRRRRPSVTVSNEPMVMVETKAQE